MVRGNYYFKRLGDCIRKLRKDKDLSQEKLALLSGVDRSYLAEVELGKANPSIRFLHKVSKTLKIGVDGFLKNV